MTGGFVLALVTKTVLVYNIATNAFKELVPMNEARMNHSSTVMDDRNLYVFGGIGAHHNRPHQLASIEVLNISGNVQTAKWNISSSFSEFTARQWSIVCAIGP